MPSGKVWASHCSIWSVTLNPHAGLLSSRGGEEGVGGGGRRERERERSVQGLPANVCHRFTIKFSTVHVTVEKTDMSDPVGRVDNIPDKKTTPLKTRLCRSILLLKFTFPPGPRHSTAASPLTLPHHVQRRGEKGSKVGEGEGGGKGGREGREGREGRGGQERGGGGREGGRRVVVMLGRGDGLPTSSRSSSFRRVHHGECSPEAAGIAA